MIITKEKFLKDWKKFNENSKKEPELYSHTSKKEYKQILENLGIEIGGM